MNYNRWYLVSALRGFNLGLNEFEYNLILTKSFNYHGYPSATYKYIFVTSLLAYKLLGTNLNTCQSKIIWCYRC